MCVCTCMCICIYTYMCTYIYIFAYTYKCIYTWMRIYMYFNTYLYVYICMCIYLCIHLSMYMHIYMHTARTANPRWYAPDLQVVRACACVCVCVCISVCMHVHICIRNTYMYICVCVCICMYTYIYICIYTYRCVHKCMYMYTNKYVYTYIHIYVCVHEYMKYMYGSLFKFLCNQIPIREWNQHVHAFLNYPCCMHAGRCTNVLKSVSTHTRMFHTWTQCKNNIPPPPPPSPLHTNSNTLVKHTHRQSNLAAATSHRPTFQKISQSSARECMYTIIITLTVNSTGVYSIYLYVYI